MGGGSSNLSCSQLDGVEENFGVIENFLGGQSVHGRSEQAKGVSQGLQKGVSLLDLLGLERRQTENIIDNDRRGGKGGDLFGKGDRIVVRL